MNQFGSFFFYNLTIVRTLSHLWIDFNSDRNKNPEVCCHTEARLGARMAHSLTQHKTRQLKPSHGQGNWHGPAVELSNSASIAQSKQWRVNWQQERGIGYANDPGLRQKGVNGAPRCWREQKVNYTNKSVVLWTCPSFHMALLSLVNLL